MPDEKKFQEFPKIVYDHENSAPSKVVSHEENGKKISEVVEPVVAFKIVNDADELKAALKDGFKEEPASQHPPVAAKEKAPKEAKEKAPKEAKEKAPKSDEKK